MNPNQAVESVKTPVLSADDGFVIGSSILTLEGEIPVEFLSTGDRIITRDSGMATLVSVEAIEADCDMVWIMAGSLGHSKPEDDTLLPAGQQILLRDWRAEALSGKPQTLVSAGRLIDGEFIRSAGRKSVTLYKLTFDAPHILYVDGLELASERQKPMKAAA